MQAKAMKSVGYDEKQPYNERRYQAVNMVVNKLMRASPEWRALSARNSKNYAETAEYKDMRFGNVWVYLGK